MEITIPIKKQQVRRTYIRGAVATLLGVFLYFFYTDLAQLLFPESALKYKVVWYTLIALYIGSFLLMVAGPISMIIAFASRERWKKLLVLTDQGMISDYGPPIQDGIKGILMPWENLASYEIKRFRGTNIMVVHLKDNTAFLEKTSNPRIRTILDKRLTETGGLISLPIDVYDFDSKELVAIFESKGLTAKK